MGFFNGYKTEIHAAEKAMSAPAQWRIVEHAIDGIYIEKGKVEYCDPGYSFNTALVWFKVDFFGRGSNSKFHVYKTIEDAKNRMKETNNFTTNCTVETHHYL